MKRITFKNITAAFIALTLVMALPSCKKDEGVKAAQNQESDETFSIFKTWKCSHDDLPTENFKKMYKDLEQTVKESDISYVWKWNKHDGTSTTFTGFIAHHKSTYKHSNNEPIWVISINVHEINGNPAPGGWVGLYTSEHPKSLLLNIEPNVSGVTAPEAQKGLGSGQSGEDSIFPFKR